METDARKKLVISDAELTMLVSNNDANANVHDRQIELLDVQRLDIYVLDTL